MADMDDDELLSALGLEAEPEKASRHTPAEERIIAGFEDILRFHQANGRAPQHGANRDIFERLYAVRLDQLRQLPEALVLLKDMDTPGLLTAPGSAAVDVEQLDDEALLAELGIEAAPENSDITVLKHVRSYAQIQAAEEIADRTPCVDFDSFRAKFAEVKDGLKDGTWIAKSFAREVGKIEVGDFFIVGGQIAYVADMMEANKTRDGRDNPRLRVIFDNETESDLLLRSLSRSLYPDGDSSVGRRVVKAENLTPSLFGNRAEEGDIKSGTIYVLRSLSAQPFVVEHRELIHKIGMTAGKVETRIANAENEATYLLAGVEVVATYPLYNIDLPGFEGLIHRLFAPAQLDLTINDRFGKPVKPSEWFLVPLPVIDEAISRFLDGSITRYAYDPNSAQLVEHS